MGINIGTFHCKESEESETYSNTCKVWSIHPECNHFTFHGVGFWMKLMTHIYALSYTPNSNLMIWHFFIKIF